jgi:CRISPR-associated exonuclease Cas4
MSSLHQPIPEDDYLPLRSLNDLLYCERRCALHRIENVWVENAHTLSGTISHQRADRPVDWKCDGGREMHGLWLKSDRLRLVGKADVVEFHPVAGGRRSCGAVGEDGVIREDASAGASPSRLIGNEVPFPVEYKRGKRRKWDNDDVQLCAQAMCLEEMLGVDVPCGAVFHVKSKRRREVSVHARARAKNRSDRRAAA